MKNHPHPGRIVRQDFLEPLGLTVTEAAKALGVARQTINNLVNEKAGISAEMAVRLSKDIVTDTRIQTDLIGPVPCFFAKVGGWYRWQVVLRGPDPASLLRGKPLANWRVEVDPVSLL